MVKEKEPVKPCICFCSISAMKHHEKLEVKLLLSLITFQFIQQVSGICFKTRNHYIQSKLQITSLSSKESWRHHIIASRKVSLHYTCCLPVAAIIRKFNRHTSYFEGKKRFLIVSFVFFT